MSPPEIYIRFQSKSLRKGGSLDCQQDTFSYTPSKENTSFVSNETVLVVLYFITLAITGTYLEIKRVNLFSTDTL